ncbi:MAG: IS21 family transposase [Chloroflexi bacterium]|nr:IS21 family transposase [Chloroflexota bacterium]
MMTVEEWTTIRYLHAQGKSIRAIGKELGLARNTVRAALRQDEKPQYRRPKRPNPKLVPFAEAIEEMVLEQGFIGSRILRELAARGYEGGSTAVYSYLRTLRARWPDRRISARFETEPGQQAQFDWSPYTIRLGQEPVGVVVFCLTLGYSRRKFYWPSRDERAASIYEGLEAGLEHFGGAPKELLIDNAGSLVTNASPTHFRWNAHFLELCGHYRIRPVACQPGRPQTKGKVERPFSHLEEQLIKGNAWADLATFTGALARFAAEQDERVHGTTRERPLDRFPAEREALTPLPAHRFLGSYQALRTVSWDCLISFGGTRYSVPWQHAGSRVWVRCRQGVQVVVTSQAGEEVAQHPIPATKGVTVIDQAHYAGLRAGLPTTKRRLIEVFLERFPDHGWFVDGLNQQFPTGGAAPLRAILGLVELYPPTALVEAFAAAREYHAYSPTFLRGVLDRGDRPVLPASAARAGGSTAGIPSPVNGDLAVYQRILEAAG